jgi:hypothetical protein
MAVDRKILKALKSALSYLDNSMPALNRKDEDSLANSIWHVAAELEYVLFLFSITFEDGVDKSKWKVNPKLKKGEFGPILVTVQDLLNDTEKCIKNEKLLDAYKNAYIARHYILKVQKEFARKKREALKKK